MNSRSSNFRVMRLIILYDLPTVTKKDIKMASKFRSEIIKKGFIMMQESVYIKQCINIDHLNKELIKLSLILPKEGDVRAISITEKQYFDMKILKGEKSVDEKITEKGSLILI
ncbi:MAG: hypothetical protein TYPL_4010 [Candidatus Tyloplasma litorale]|nr:MAG: hypothetical protein TYPL_4010 [Mycoplasmatales bacterium]